VTKKQPARRNELEARRSSDISEIIGESALNTGRYLNKMAKSGLVQKPDKKKTFYEITEKGRQYLANPPEEIETEELERTTEWNHRGYD
jgi:predicted transcriptional regulator